MADLIERVAKAIEDADANGFTRLPYEACARAAIAEVAKEFALIAESDVGEPNNADGEDYALNERGNWVARNIARAIRNALESIDTERELDRLAKTPM